MSGTARSGISKAPLLTGLAAMASAALFLSISTGVGAASLVVHFVQLPLIFVGFTLGLTSASLSAAIALAMVLAFGSGMAAFTFLALEVGPSLITVRHGLLSRPATPSSSAPTSMAPGIAAGTEQAPALEWYPAGIILGRLTIYMTLLMALAIAWVDVETGDVIATFSSAIAEVGAQLGPAVDGERLAASMSAIVPGLPGIIAASLLLVSVLNGALGHALARSQGNALRPAAELRSLRLPGWCMPALAAALVAGFLVDGTMGMLAWSAALVLLMPFLLLGLAVVHTLAKRLSAPRLALALFYALLLLFSLPLVPTVVGLGLIEDRLQLRRKMP